MAQNITLIVADESVAITDKVPHFYENGYVIIPLQIQKEADVGYIRQAAKKGMTIDEIFEVYIDKYYFPEEDASVNLLEEHAGYNNELDDYEDLYVIELIQRLQLKDFSLFHYDDFLGDDCLIFENGRYVSSYPESESPRLRMDKPYLYKYEGCKVHCLRSMEKRKKDSN